MLVTFWLFICGWLEFLSNPVMSFFRRISFALYLLHFEIPIAIMALLQINDISVLLATFPAIVLAVLLATVQTLYWEEPLKIRLKRFSAQWFSRR